MATSADVARIAAGFADLHRRGRTSVGQINGETVRLAVGGFCARLVRQCHEQALGLGAFDWPFSAATALVMEAKLKDAGREVAEADAVPGDVVAINRGSGQYGHIGIYLGAGQFAENTSSRVRNAAYLGRAGVGTCISPLSAVADRITGYYRGVTDEPLGHIDGVKVILQRGDDWRLIPCDALFDGNRVTCDAAALALALGVNVPAYRGRAGLRDVANAWGFTATWHPEQGEHGKVYLTTR